MIVRLWFAVLTAAEMLTTTTTTTTAAATATAAAAVAMRLHADDSMPRGFQPKTLSYLNLVPYDTVYHGIVNRSRTEFHVLIHQDTDRSLSVTVTPCNARLNWDLKFIPLTINQTIILGYNKSNEYGKLLVEYTGVPTPVTYNHGRAYRGLYVITVQAIDDESNVMVYVSLRQKSPKKPFGFRPNQIRIKEGSQKISLKWNLSHIDHHLMHYSLVVSTSKIYSNLCEAESRLEEKQKWNANNSEHDLLLDDRLEVHYLEFDTNYTLTGLMYGTTYYFTVFAMNGSRMPVQHANATYTFQKPRPVPLKDARPKMINLRARNGKASFRYKVGSKSLEIGGDTKTLYWYVMPCGGVVNVEIRCRKTLLLKKRVFGYEKLILNDTKYGERYVLKVETASVDETHRVRSVEVLATVRPKKFPMPDMPSDLTIKQYVRADDCQSVTIGWLPARSNTDLLYCVYVQEYRHSNSVDFSVKPDQCGLSSYGRRHDTGSYRRRIRCYVGEKDRKVSTEKILKLKSTTTYVIQVTVAKPRGRTLSYDLLMLDTNTCDLN